MGRFLLGVLYELFALAIVGLLSFGLGLLGQYFLLTMWQFIELMWSAT